MSTATTTAPTTPAPSREPAHNPTHQLPHNPDIPNAVQRLCTTMAAVSSSPWLSLRATRSRACGSGLPVGACRRTGRGCIRERK